MRLRALFLLCSLLWPSWAWAAVAFDAQCSGGANAATTVSCSITVGSGSDRVLYITAHNDWEGADNINTPTVGGSSTGVTLVQSHAHSFGDTYWQKVYRLVAPSTGTATVQFTTGAASNLAIGAVSYSGVDQATPDRTPTVGTGTASSPSTSITTTSGDVVAEFFWWRSNNSNRLLTFDGSQASRINRPNSETGVGVSDETSAGSSVVASGTLDFTDNWMVVGVPMIAASGGGGGGTTRNRMLMGVGQ